jgi:hypothetical protein
MGAEVLSNEQLSSTDDRQRLDDPGWGGQAPLWFYILKEAQRQQNGERLGQVGGRIVAEVFLGLLERDANSYLRRDPSFRPSPDIAGKNGQFGIVDLLKFAKVA